MIEHHILDQTEWLNVWWTAQFGTQVNFLGLLTKMDKVKVNVDMDSLMAQASCAEQNWW
jgi:hypothetical protein